MIKGAIHSIETFGSVDGPGVRFVIFVRGCKMRCRYCHNADTWKMQTDNMKTADELLDQAERYKAYWGAEGGITVSGGEPLLQIDFLLELFKKAKERGIKTCIDTAGQPFTREEPFFSKFKELMQYTDLLLVDIKHIDPEEHMKLTAQPNENIHDMFRYLSEIDKPIWIRHVLVPGITDDDRWLRETRKFIETLHNVQRIEVLPYHSLGEFKWEELGVPYTLGGVNPPDADRVKNATEILRGEKE
uniref:pyruvate formate-lyase-activating protein n=1 Tax=Eubacterium cellulosolvens TaxID=29322 RepID=UPI000481AE57|nr:pyruvate formate-lyase-activating protein [[Eubacterium] cellulosolvens]